MDNITAETPLLERMTVPPVFTSLTRNVDKLAEAPSLAPRTEFPTPSFAFARKDMSGRPLPQAIAHRGYKAKFPENTMGAFKGAVEVGAHAIETDIHLSKDGVVVLSHDVDLKRCFGRPEKIIDCNWSFLSTLQTLKEPRQSMPRLSDLLEYLAQPGLEDIWLLLDIKLDNNADDVIRLIGETIRRVSPSDKRPWHDRVVLGCWAAKYLPLCDDYLPGFPITHIGFSILYAYHFLKVPNVSFNLLLAVLMTPWGEAFIKKAKAQKRPIFAWTVNDERRMRWGIRKELDGIITDDPKLFLEVRKGWYEGMKENFGFLIWWDVLKINFLALIFGFLFRRKFGLCNEKVFVRPTGQE